MSDVAKPQKVIFRYPNSKGLFVEVSGFKPGGAPIQMYTLATELAKDDRYNVYFWVDGDAPEERIENIQLFTGPQLIQRGVPVLSRLINNKRKKEFASIFSDAVTIFTVADMNNLPVLQEQVHSAGGKTIYRVASDIDVDPSLRFADGSDLFSQALRAADAIVVQTGVQHGLLKGKLGLDSTLINSAFRKSKATNWSSEIILWVGQALPIKRPWVVLELAREYPNEEFVMVMPPSDMHIANAIKDQAKALKNVDIVDFVEVREIQNYYNRAKLVLNTSVNEGFPNTIHQAALGKAPYISLKWNPGNYLERNNKGRAADNDVRKLVEIVGEYLSKPELIEFEGQQSYQNFTENNDVEVVIEQYKELIKRLVC